MSPEVPHAASVRSGGGQRNSGDRLAAVEGKLARLESKPKQNREKRVAMYNGREVCFHYNSREGCKRQTIPGGCKSDKREFSHACIMWVKAKNGYCLQSHAKRDHK